MSHTSKPTVALVTGANQGIGLEIVKKLARENPTYHVLLSSRNLSKGTTAVDALGSPKNVEPIQLDVTDDSSIAACAKSIEEKFGKLDVLIQNAAIGGRELPESYTDRQRFKAVYDTNVFSVVALTEVLLPLLRKAEKPRIVMVSSGVGSITNMSDPGQWAFMEAPWYSSSKASMNWLVAWYARKLKDEGVVVNACCPGFNRTQLNGFAEGAGDPSQGAINACRLAVDVEGTTGTFTNKERVIPW